jgi:uncharacterized protein YciI
MNKTFYAIKLIAPRADFAQTMTDDEKAVMGAHAQYWTEHMAKGMVHVFGPVFDPKGVYGFGVVSVENEAELKQFIDNDPALQLNEVEYYPMMAMVAGM